MPDLGRAFLAAAARSPSACAIVDGDRRLTYAGWLDRIRRAVGGLDALGLRPGDHLVTSLRNRLEAATLHWACQLAGVVITPVNWRATRDELGYVLRDADARALVYEPVSAGAVAGAAAGAGTGAGAGTAAGARSDRTFPPHRARRRPARDRLLGARLRVGGGARRSRAARHRRRPLGHALHLRHHRARQGGAAPSPGGAGGRPRPHRTPPVRVRRIHPGGHAPLPHDGGAFAPLVRLSRRRLRLPAALRCGEGPRPHRGGRNHLPLPGADPVPRPPRPSGVLPGAGGERAAGRLRGHADDRRAGAPGGGGVSSAALRQPLRLVGGLHVHHRPAGRTQAGLGRPGRAQPGGEGDPPRLDRTGRGGGIPRRGRPDRGSPRPRRGVRRVLAPPRRGTRRRSAEGGTSPATPAARTTRATSSSPVGWTT